MSTKIPTHKPLPGAWELVVDSWNFFTKTFSTTIKTSILFLYAGIVIFIFALLTRRSADLFYINGLILLLSGLFTLWVSIRLTVLILRLLSNKKALSQKEESQLGFQLIVPFVFINILVGLITLGGTILFILPGIYFAISLTMANVILIDKGIRGTQALAASRDLIKGRWWPTFGRLLVGGFLFAILFVAVLSVLTFLITTITGSSFSVAPNTYDLLPYGLDQFLQMATMAVFLPLVMGYQVKVYQALQKTR
ncbi:MAG: hypothetical protein NUV81_04295 [bacterium]|nr:hypothetical protein [bacterium]